MAKNRLAYYTKEGRISSGSVSGNSSVNIFTAGVDGSKISGITLVGVSGTGSLTLKLNGSSDILGKTNPTISDLDLMDLMSAPKTNAGSKYFNIPPGAIISAATTSSLSVTVSIYGEDY